MNPSFTIHACHAFFSNAAAAFSTRPAKLELCLQATHSNLHEALGIAAPELLM